MGNADYFADGQWNFYCDFCGKKAKSSSAMRTWNNLYVCRSHKEVRNPQDFIRGVKDDQSVPWSRPNPNGGAFVPLSAGFTASPLYGTSPMVVSFTDTSTGSPTSWYWDFGDGTSSTLQNPSHTYSVSGSQQIYTVILTVRNGAGSSTLTKASYIAVGPNPPVTDSFGLTDSVSVIAGTTVAISDSFSLTESVSLVTSLTYSLSDSFGLTENVQVNAAGNSTVSDSLGLTESSTRSITTSPSDTTTLTDSVTSSLDRTASVSDTIGLSESVSVTRDVVVNLSDTTTISDSVTSTINYASTSTLNSYAINSGKVN